MTKVIYTSEMTHLSLLAIEDQIIALDLADELNIKVIKTWDLDSSFGFEKQDVVDFIEKRINNKYLKKIAQRELEVFHKSDFYKNWGHYYEVELTTPNGSETRRFKTKQGKTTYINRAIRKFGKNNCHYEVQFIEE